MISIYRDRVGIIWSIVTAYRLFMPKIYNTAGLSRF